MPIQDTLDRGVGFRYHIGEQDYDSKEGTKVEDRCELKSQNRVNSPSPDDTAQSTTYYLFSNYPLPHAYTSESFGACHTPKNASVLLNKGSCPAQGGLK
jgi:hypothetical protein